MFSQIATPLLLLQEPVWTFCPCSLSLFDLYLFTRSETRFVNTVDCLSPHPHTTSQVQPGVARNPLCENGQTTLAELLDALGNWASLTFYCVIGDLKLLLFTLWDGGMWGRGGGKTASSLQLSQRKAQLEWRKAAKTTHFLPAADICLS